jgi:LAO/AO transport system kinase
MSKLLSINEYVNGIISGNISILSKAITLIESRNAEHQVLAADLIEAILPYSGNAIRIGITGVPGVGKSTFIDAFGLHLVQKNKKIAVLAIDPSSTISKGSILGDKTRMETLSVHPNAFIRPTASGGSLGGVTYKTKETIMLCEAAGFNTIIVETVGVGQSETDVNSITDFFLLLMLAGAGDELQGIKRGIMEMADGIVITKADGNNVTKAKSARAEFANALHFFPPTESGWIPEVKTCSAITKTGIEEVEMMIDKFHRHALNNGYFSKKRQEQNLISFHKLLDEQIKKQFLSSQQIKNQIDELYAKVKAGILSPYGAVKSINWGDN